ncbi:MAG: DUF1501 domain-containing protein [Gemmataceae bacterium]|nr:DUF1501 domain-containing protein [Gemmataceae bacterium]
MNARFFFWGQVMLDLMSTDRRHFMKHMAGLTALAASGSNFVSGLRAAEKTLKKSHKSLIVLWMGGGPSTIDLWDLKPGHANGGEFKPIETAASGVQICEHLPQLAKQFRHLSIVRSMKTSEGDHDRGTRLMITGRAPSPVVQFPAIGSVMAHQLTPKDLDLPGFVSIGGTGARIGPGFLGMSFAPFTIQNAGAPPENISTPNGLNAYNMKRREELFKDLDLRDKEFLRRGEAAKAHNEIYEKAFKLVFSERRNVFGLESNEDKAMLAKYGDNPFGKGCLVARKLVEAGCVCVEVDLGGWDNHNGIFAALKGRLPNMDKAMAALTEDLYSRGILKDTVVLWMGEFGRTPKINQNGGRDHFPGAWSVVVGGGSIKGGQVIGSTEADGMSVRDNPVGVGELFATVYKGLGLDPNVQIRDNLGRPTAIAGDNVKPIAGLV